MSHPAGNDARTWAQRHGLATGHHTVESLTDPGSCLDCSERSPAYQMTRLEVREAERLALSRGRCNHEWTERGSGDLTWRECWLCGEQTPYETRPIPPGEERAEASGQEGES